MEKEITNKYKQFLIKLIRNNEYYASKYNRSELTFLYKGDNSDIRVVFKYKRHFFNSIKFEIDDSIQCDMGYIMLFIFDRNNWNLYKGILSIRKNFDKVILDEQYNKINNVIPKKYHRLDKIEKLKSKK